MSQDDWRIVVFREMQAELWYEPPEQDEPLSEALFSDMSVLLTHRNGSSPKVTVAAG